MSATLGSWNFRQSSYGGKRLDDLAGESRRSEETKLPDPPTGLERIVESQA